MKIPLKSKVVSIVLKIIVVAAAAIGAVLLLSDRKIGRAWFAIKFVGTVSITLTGAVFAFVVDPGAAGAAARRRVCISADR